MLYMILRCCETTLGEKKFIRLESADGPTPLWVRRPTRIIDNLPHKPSIWFGLSHYNKLLHMRAQCVQARALVPY